MRGFGRFMVCVELIPPPFLAPGHDAGAWFTTLGAGNVLLHGVNFYLELKDYYYNLSPTES